MKLSVFRIFYPKAILAFVFFLLTFISRSEVSESVLTENAPLAQPSIQPANAKFCSPGGWLYIADVPSNADSFVWYRNGAIVGSDNDSLFISTIGTSTYSCVLFNNKVKLDSIFVQATVAQSPKADFSFNPPGGCGKTKIAFTDKSTPTGSIQSWSWNFGDAGSGNNTSNSQNPTHTFKPTPGTGTQSYTVTLTVTHDNGCVSTKDTIITIGRGPDATLSGSPALQDYNGQPFFTYCLSNNETSNTFTFFNQSTTATSNSSYIIKWGDGTQNNFDNSWAKGSIASHSYSIGLYKLTFIVYSSTCVDSIQYNVFVGSNPGGSISSPANTYGCTNQTFSFPFANVSNNSPGTQYVISVNDGTDTVRFTQENLPAAFTHTFNKSSCGSLPNNTFTVSYLITNPCSETPGTIGGIRISQKAEADFTISPNDTICQNNSIQFTSVGKTGLIVPQSGGGSCTNGNLLWDITPSTGWTLTVGSFGLSNSAKPNSWTSGSNSITVNFNQPGTYNIKLKTGTDQCGSDSIIKYVCVNPPPTAAFTINRDSICAGEINTALGQTNTGNCGPNIFKWTMVYSPIAGCLPAIADYVYVNGTDSTKQNPQVRFNSPGIYTWSLQTYAPGLACSSAIVSKQIVVRGKPIVSVTGLPTEVCYPSQPLNPSGSATCFIDANTKYLWTFPSGTTPLTSSNLPAPGTVTLPIGSNSIKFKASNICGSDSAVSLVKVTALPTASISYLNAGVFCNNKSDSQYVSITGTKGGVFSSSSAGLNINTNTGAVVPSTSTPGTYSVFYSIPASGGCAAVTTSATVLITAAPSGSISYSGNYCNTINTPVAVIFNNIASGGTFSVTPSSGLNIDLNGGTINPSLSIPGTYSIEYSLPASGGCTSYTTPNTTVIIYPKPVISGVDSVCKGLTVKLSTVGSAPAALSPWISSNGFILSVDNSGLVTGNNSGAENIYFTDDKGCKDTFSIRVNPLPVITGPTDVCVGSVIKLIGTQFPAAVNPWTSSAPAIATVNNGVTKDTGLVKGVTVGAVTITYKNSSNCLITYTVNVRSVPSISGDTSSPIKCKDPSGSITISGLASSTSYTLYYNNGAPIPITSNASGQYVITGLQAGTYSNLYVESQYNCRSNILSFTLVDPNPPATPMAANDTALCSGNSVTLSVTSTKPNIKYYWSGPGVVPNTQGTFITITNAQTAASGKYYVIADSINCRSNSDSISLTVYPTPPVPTVTRQISYCQYEVASPLTAAVASGSTLIWYNSNMVVLPSAPTPPTNSVGTFKYYVSQRNITDTCQSGKDSITVTIKPKPKITGYKINPVNCATATGIIILKGVIPGSYQVKYDTSGVSVIRSISTANDSLIVDNLVAQNYSNIHILLSGCPSDTISQFILSDPNPPDTPKLQSNSPVCSGNAINVTVKNTVSGGVYAWSGPNGLISGSSGPSIIISNSSKADSGLYKVSVTLNNCRSIAGEINVIIYQTPPVPVVTTPIYYCRGDVAQPLTAAALNSKHYIRWYAAASGGIGTADAPVPSTQNAGTTTYYVSQISSDSCEGPRTPVDVVIRQIPDITDMTKTVCSGDKISITPSGSGLPANTQYYWYLPVVSNSDSLKDASADSAQISFHDTLFNVSDFVQTALYTVYPVSLYVPALACPGAPFKIDVTVNPSPKVRFSIPNDSICSGGLTKQVILISPTPGAVISWNSPAVPGISGNIPSGNSIIPEQTLLNSTINPLVVKYIAQAVNTGGFSCPGIPSNYEVTVAPIPSVNDVVKDICSGSFFSIDSAFLGVSNLIPKNTRYTWAITTNNTNIIGQNNQILPVSAISDTLFNTSNVPQKIIYTVQAISGDLLGCPGRKFNIEVTVNPTPVILPLFDTICSGKSFSLLPANAFPDTLVPINTTYSWNIPSEPNFIRGLTSGNSQTQISGLLYNDSYSPHTVSYQVIPVSGDKGFCKGDTFDVLITVNPLASISNNPLYQLVCNSGISQPVTWTSFSSGASYSWKLIKSGSITGFTGDDSGPGLASMQLGNNLHYPDTLRYAVSSTANECAAPATNYDIIVNPDSKAEFIYPKDTSCWPFDIVINNTSRFWSSDPSVPNDRFEWYAIDSNNIRTLIGTQRNFPGYVMAGPGQRISIRLVAYNKYGCLNDSIAHTFYTKPKPEPVFSINPVSGCGPLLVSFTNQTVLKDSFEYSWNFGNSQSSVLSDPPPVLFYNDTIRFVDTTYFIELKAYNECISVYDTVSVFVLSKPKARFLPSTSTACSNAQILLSNTSLGVGNRYEWHFSDTTSILYSDTNNNVPRVYSSGTIATFTDTLIAINQCGRDTAVYPVLVTPNTIKPNFVVTAGTKVGCAPLTVQLINASKGGTRFIWYFGDPTDPDSLVTLKNTDTIYHRYDSAGVYAIKLNVINACTDSTDFDTIRVLRTPNASFNYTAGDICVGQPVKFTNTTDLATNYIWDLGIPPVSNNVNPVISYPQSGTYNVQLIAVLTDPTGLQCRDTAKGSVVIVDSLSGLFTTSADTGYCTPFTVTFTNQTPSTGIARWDFGDGTTGVGNIVSHTFDSAGTYKVYMMVTDPGGCKFGYFKNIVAGGPFGSLLYQPDTVCGDKPVRFEAAVNKVDSIRWDFGDGTVITTTAKIVYHVYKVPGTYIPSVELIAGPGANCRIFVPGKDTIRVDYLGAGFSTSLTNYCDSTKLILTDTSYSYSGIQKWSWTLGNGNAAASQNVTTHYYSSGNYSVRQIITTRYGCTDTSGLIIPIKVNATPVAGINAPNAGCENDTINFIGNIQSADLIDSLKWQGVLTGYGTSLSAPFSVPGNYSISLIAGTIFGCFDTAIHNFVINPLPEIAVRENKTICLGQSAQLTAVTNAASVTWAGTQWLSCSNCLNPVATPPVTTRYVATAVSVQGCKNYDAALITVKQPIEIQASGEDTICIGDQVTLSVSGANRYQWYPADSISCTTCANPTVKPSNTTTYMVVGFDSDNTSDLCFTDTQYIVVTVGHFPIIQLPSDTLVQTGSHLKPVPAISYAAGSNFEPIRFYSWSPRSLIDSFPDSSVPVIKALRNQCYQLEVENIYGCKATDDFCIKVYCENTQVFIPNAFTPSQNNNNRFWVRTKGINKIKSFRVFNRWGEVVFEKNNYTPVDGIGVLNPPEDQGWDGRVRGVLANPDVYVYMVEVLCENQVSFSYKGNVTLLR